MFTYNLKRKTNTKSDTHQAMKDAAQGCGVLTVTSPLSSFLVRLRTSQELPFVIRA